ncbi:zinc finger protein 185 isoform X2 [Pelobates fuscus]|uniref:zinc finger protein 185 isoform X2 n=1 Tax=Pelobates fuscus TaxID=191477 RepID=UPI002FE44955
MTSVQAKKAGVSVEADRQNVITQMKVRTKLKTDKSWINRQSSEDEKDEGSTPVSPQLKSLEGRKFLWSPHQESSTDRDSPTFGAKEPITRTSSFPIQSSDKPPTYSANNATNNSPSPAQPSPPPSTASDNSSARTSSGYIIRGQPMNASQQAKSNAPYNGFQKSYSVQQKSASLPRVPSATGYKMTTEEYKKLAPYNTRNKSADLSDEETTFTPTEQAKRTEVASSILKNSASKDRSYVFSAAKRYSGVSSPTENNNNPFVAKKVQVQEENESVKKRSETLPKSEDTSSGQNTSSPKLTTRTITEASSPPVKAQPGKISPQKDDIRPNASSPKLTTRTITETSSPPIKPQPGKISPLKDDRDDNKVPQNSTEYRSTTTRTVTTRNDGTPAKQSEDLILKSGSLPKSLASYLYDDNYREKHTTSPKSVSTVTDGSSSAVKPQPGKITVIKDESTDNHVTPRTSTENRTTATTRTVTTSTERAPVKEDDSLSDSLHTYLSEDASRFEKNWKAAQSNPSISHTSPPRSTTTRNVTTVTTNESGTDNAEVPRLKSYTNISIIETTTSNNFQPAPGKITIIRDESDLVEREIPKTSNESRSVVRTSETRSESSKNNDDIPKLTSWTSTNVSETTKPGTQVGPGKISVVRDESLPPKPAPRIETKPKVTAVESSNANANKPQDLISWDDLDTKPENRPKESTKPSTVSTIREARYLVPELLEEPGLTNSSRPTSESGNRTTTRETYYESPKSERSSSPRPTVSSTISEARYRVPEILEDPKPNTSATRPTSESGNRTTTRETYYESPKSERSSSPRPTVSSTISEARYRVPEILEDPKPNTSATRPISDSANTSVTTTTRETRYESSRPSVDVKSERSSSPRPAPRSRDSAKTTVTESSYKVPENLDNTMLESSPASGSTRTTITTTRSTDPNYTEFLDNNSSRSLRQVLQEIFILF